MQDGYSSTSGRKPEHFSNKGNTVMNSTNEKLFLGLVTNANYVKLVEAINRAKEMKPLVTVPKGVLYNPAYYTYPQ